MTFREPVLQPMRIAELRPSTRRSRKNASSVASTAKPGSTGIIGVFSTSSPPVTGTVPAVTASRFQGRAAQKSYCNATKYGTDGSRLRWGNLPCAAKGMLGK